MTHRTEEVDSISLNVQIKLEQAMEEQEKIEEFSHAYFTDSGNENYNLLRIGSHMGTLINHLRTALNYSIREYAELYIKGTMSDNKYKNLHMNFPYGETIGSFRKQRFSKFLRNSSDPCNLNALLENTQQRDIEWLPYLMKLSNTDKHIEINSVNVPEYQGLGILAPYKLILTDNELIVQYQDEREDKRFSTPYFFEPAGAFANNGKWVILNISVSDKKMIGVTKWGKSAIIDTRMIATEIHQLTC